MTPLIVGCDGNMGRRYQAILNHLNITYWGVEADGVEWSPVYEAPKWDGVIIATPTRTHADLIKEYATYGVPILCEKPITTNIDELYKLVHTVECHDGCSLQMVNQYEVLATYGDGPTSYDYFKSGSDGIYWDTINIGALARGEFEAKNTSPIWKCTINGKPLNLADIDGSYIAMMRQWLQAPRNDLAYIIVAHERAAKRSLGVML